nr:26S proteasome non ATPase regulatory subunit [Hymenolepis microstoma]
MNGNSTELKEFQDLEKKRKAIEDEIGVYTEILKSNRNVGMHGPLVDPEGFPRNDIDLVAVRTARNKIICLNTDYNELMTKLEEVSSRLLAKQSLSTAEAMDTETPFEPLPKAFLTVDQVTPGSPSDLAGIRVGDRIVRFGSLLSSNFTGLSAVVEVVKATAPKDSIPVSVVREEGGSSNLLRLVLTKPEGGQSLGFHIVPIK